MRTGMGVLAAFSLLAVIMAPASAAVTSASIDRDTFISVESFTISGTVDDSGATILTATLGGPGVKNLIRSASSNPSDGTFEFLPIPVSDVFTREGKYTINVFTQSQPVASGTVIEMIYKDGVATVIPDYDLVLVSIGSKSVTETETLRFVAEVADAAITGEKFSLSNAPPGAAIDEETGEFSWTPDGDQSGIYRIDIVVKSGPLVDMESISVTVHDKPAPATPPPDPEPADPEPAELGVASFVDGTRDPQYYVDRYHNDPAYTKWFDDNYSQYDSIYHAVGLEEPLEVPAPFVDGTRDPQYYVDRYDNEVAYKKWFDENYPEYDSIYHAVGMEKPLEIPAPFVDGKRDPQSYVDRYDNEVAYKKWFDENYPEYDSISQAVGLEAPAAAAQVPKAEVPKNEMPAVVPDADMGGEFGECGEGTDLVDGTCIVVADIPGGGCLIATAAYGTEMAPQVQMLREIRDNQLMETGAGASFMAGFNPLYYSFSPHVADMARESPALREAIRAGITPMLSSLSLMAHAETDAEVLGYGVGVILLNLGMYVAAPAVAVLAAKNALKSKGGPRTVVNPN